MHLFYTRVYVVRLIECLPYARHYFSDGGTARNKTKFPALLFLVEKDATQINRCTCQAVTRAVEGNKHSKGTWGKGQERLL